MKKQRRTFSGALKAKIAIEALKERETLAELARRYEVHPNMISKWKQEFLERSGEIFEKKSEKEAEVDTEKLYAKIGQLEIENDFFLTSTLGHPKLKI